MPTYQYTCTVCDHQMEVVQSFSEDSLTVCPECDGRLRKVYSAVGIVFKGSGFYHTDNGSGRSAPSSGGTESSGDDNGHKDDKGDKGDASQATEKAGAGSADNGSSTGSQGGSEAASGSSSGSGSSGSSSTTAVAST